MRKRIKILSLALALSLSAAAQIAKVYDESIDPMQQIDEALQEARKSNKQVVCQVGGNWCRWCLMLADYVAKEEEIAKAIEENYIYIHVNYPTDGSAKELQKRLGNPGRFGYPSLVVLDGEGRRLHTQDSSFLEEGNGYNKEKVLRFLNCWTRQAVAGEK